MQYASVLTVVEQVGGLTPEEAERAIETTLASKEFRDMAVQPPDEYAPLLAATA